MDGKFENLIVKFFTNAATIKELEELAGWLNEEGNSKDFDMGLVTEKGFNALHEAESYDQASSISACSKNLARLLKCLHEKGVLHLHAPNSENLIVSTTDEFEKWATAYFPSSYSYLSKYGS